MNSGDILMNLLSLSLQADLDREITGDSGLINGVMSKSLARRLLAALQHRDEATVRHARRTAMISVALAEMLGWDAEHRSMLEVAALMHDLGKIGIPDHILYKPARLSPEEYDLICLQHRIAVDVLQACRVDREVLAIVSQLHTHYNGAADGFQRIGSDVHQGARILSVADAYDSLGTRQAFRDAMPHDQIMNLLAENSGSRFDGNVVSAMARWTEDEGLAFVESSEDERQVQYACGALRHDETLEANAFAGMFTCLQLLENLYDGYYVVDAETRFVVWSCSMVRLTGVEADVVLDDPWSREFVRYASSVDRSRYSDEQVPLKRAAETRQAHVDNMQMLRADETWRDVEVIALPLLDRAGQLHGVAELIRDRSRRTMKGHEYRELRLAATQDPLTSIANRGQLESQLTQMLKDFHKSKDPEPLSIMFLDVDRFKTINDRFGHAVGDQVLIELTRLIQHETYSGELFGRYGGEEFVLVCPGTDLKHAVRRAERLRMQLQKAQLGGDTELETTASFGVAQAKHGDDLRSLIKRADDSLYRAKQSGRNRTCWPDEDGELDDDLVVESEEQTSRVERDTKNGRFVYRTSMQIYFARELIEYKLNGFASDNDATLLALSQDGARLQVGVRGLIPFWGNSDVRQPVELVMTFSPLADLDGGRSRRLEAKVNIHALGRIQDREIFETRCRRVYRSLRSYLSGD